MSRPTLPRMAMGRRRFLKYIALMGLVLGRPGGAGAFLSSGFPIRTVEKPEFGFDSATGRISGPPDLDGPYRLTVDGLVESPVTLTYAELRAMPQVEQVSDFHCVEGWTVPDVTWGGLRFSQIMGRIKVKPGGDFVLFHSLGRTRFAPDGQEHYIESFPLSRLLDPQAQVLLVLDMNGQPLPLDHGAPLRIISPFELAYKSIKFVTRIEFISTAVAGWWTLANPIYPIEAPVPGHRLRKKN